MTILKWKFRALRSLLLEMIHIYLKSAPALKTIWRRISIKKILSLKISPKLVIPSVKSSIHSSIFGIQTRNRFVCFHRITHQNLWLIFLETNFICGALFTTIFFPILVQMNRKTCSDSRKTKSSLFKVSKIRLNPFRTDGPLWV